ncbi:MAG: SMP-30/gluconolactonase/LRE family protein [Gammaproteobacteria bacterium]|nr:SMP-30/gluconolactonase/LRE family protein [Gammaproteobacteria bacterium]
MKRPGTPATLVIAIALMLVGYLLLWPVPVDPVAWSAPGDRGLVDPFATNDILGRARAIELPGHDGPEDVATPFDGFFYASTADGKIIRFRPNGSGLEVFANLGGRPLGIDFDSDGNLLVANAYLGLQRVTPEGRIDLLVDEVGGKQLAYVNDVAAGANGIVYFSDSSSKFGAEAHGGTYPASLIDILEHGGHGRVLRHDTKSGSTDVLMDGLNFANGVAISEDQQYLIIAETGHYRIWRHWLAGDRAEESEVILDNLPGFPDNVNNGMQGRFWIGLVAPRVAILDKLSDKPFLRKAVQRMPAFVKPKAVPSTHAIAITGDGVVLMNLQDTAASYPAITGVMETRDAIYLSTLFGNVLPRLDKNDLVRD